jgi:hypothetical protein
MRCDRYLFFVILLYKNEELFTVIKAAASKNGVVGKIGIKIPIIPAINKIKAKKFNRKIFIIHLIF